MTSRHPAAGHEADQMGQPEAYDETRFIRDYMAFEAAAIEQFSPELAEFHSVNVVGLTDTYELRFGHVFTADPQSDFAVQGRADLFEFSIQNKALGSKELSIHMLADGKTVIALQPDAESAQACSNELASAPIRDEAEPFLDPIKALLEIAAQGKAIDPSDEEMRAHALFPLTEAFIAHRSSHTALLHAGHQEVLHVRGGQLAMMHANYGLGTSDQFDKQRSNYRTPYVHLPKKAPLTSIFSFLSPLEQVGYVFRRVEDYIDARRFEVKIDSNEYDQLPPAAQITQRQQILFHMLELAHASEGEQLPPNEETLLLYQELSVQAAQLKQDRFTPHHERIIDDWEPAPVKLLQEIDDLAFELCDSGELNRHSQKFIFHDEAGFAISFTTDTDYSLPQAETLLSLRLDHPKGQGIQVDFDPRSQQVVAHNTTSNPHLTPQTTTEALDFVDRTFSHNPDVHASLRTAVDVLFGLQPINTSVISHLATLMRQKEYLFKETKRVFASMEDPARRLEVIMTTFPRATGRTRDGLAVRYLDAGLNTRCNYRRSQNGQHTIVRDSFMNKQVSLRKDAPSIATAQHEIVQLAADERRAFEQLKTQSLAQPLARDAYLLCAALYSALEHTE